MSPVYAFAGSVSFRIAILIFAAFFSLFPLPAWSARENLCPSGLSVQRTGAAPCWAKLSLRGIAGTSVCVPRQLWMKWLDAEGSQTAGLCGAWEGKWRAKSFPENRPGHPKTVQLEWAATRLPREPPSLLYSGFPKQLEKIREDISGIFRGVDSTGVIRKLLLNEGMPGGVLPFLRTLGFVHLFTSSGIHLWSLASVTERITATASRSLGIRVVPALRFARVLSAILWCLAWMLSGMRPGMFRPWIVILARVFANSCGLRWRRGAPLAVALVADLSVGAFHALGSGQENILDWAPGRVHYALAVGGGFMALDEWRRRGSKSSAFMDHAVLAVGSWVLVALIDIGEHGLVSLATPALSLLTLPVFSAFVWPGLFGIIFLHWLRLDELASFSAQMMGCIVQCAVEIPAEAAMALPSLWMVRETGLVIGALGGGIVMLSGRRGWVVCGVCVVLIGVRVTPFVHSSFAPATRPPLRAEKIEQLDIAQGDAALVQVKGPIVQVGQIGMIDVGPEKALSLDAWLKLFAARGIAEISWVALTHLDEDHAGGLLRIAQVIPVGCIRTSRQELETERGRRFQEKLEARGHEVLSWEIPCIPFQVEGPSGRSNKKKNGNMSAVWIPLSDGRNWLSMGDADKKQERRLLKWVQGQSSAPGSIIFKVSHHGSRFSSDEFLIKALKPNEAWISSGVGNSYGHPTHDVVARFMRLGIRLRRTDQEGVLAN